MHAQSMAVASGTASLGVDGPLFVIAVGQFYCEYNNMPYLLITMITMVAFISDDNCRLPNV